MMSDPAEKQPDHAGIIAFLAKESNLPAADIATLYELEYAKLALGARVKSFLHTFAIRNVQEILRKRAADNLQTCAAILPALAA